MEQFRVKVEKRLKWMKVLVMVFLLALAVIKLVPKFPGTASLTGACIGGIWASLAVIFQQSKCLKDEKKLRKLWIEENDERMKAIRVKAGQPFVIFWSLALLAASVVAGFFNEVVADTLVMVAVVQLLISLIIKGICTQRM